MLVYGGGCCHHHSVLQVFMDFSYAALAKVATVIAVTREGSLRVAVPGPVKSRFREV